MSTYSWDAILSHVARKLSEIGGAEVEAADLVAPPDPTLGDVAYGCFKLSKSLGKPPVEIAKLIETKLGKGDHTIESVKAAGPYVNISLKAGDLIARVIHDVARAERPFGMGEAGAGKSLLLEYAQPNTHKEIHIGHLRNLLIGSSLDHVLQTAGWKVVPVSYHGDVGAHVAKCLWFFVRSRAALIPQPEPLKKKELAKKSKAVVKKIGKPKALSAAEWSDKVLSLLDDEMAETMLRSVPKAERTGEFLGKLYSESTKLLEENPDWKEQVSDVQRKLESKASGWDKLWAETRRWSIDEMIMVFQELGVKLAKMYFESDDVVRGLEMVDELLKRGIARVSEGAVIVDLEEDKLGTFVIRKSDGTTLYATKDLSLAERKAADYPDVSRSLHVVDARQEFRFRQLFRTLELMGYRMPLEYVGYEFVTLASGAMSSRQGNVVSWTDFRDEVLAFATKETIERHPEWVEGRVTHTAWCLAMGGIKFGMLKQDSDKIFTFDLTRALSFDGDTGPYIQYAATRLAAILKKGKWDAKSGFELDPVMLGEPSEKRLALQIAAFPSICRKAAEELRPSLIAQWCVTMAQRVNEFYRDVHVLEGADQVRQARLQLVAVSHQVLAQALALLGIPLPDEM